MGIASSLSIGILSWKASDTLEATLASYNAGGLSDLSEDRFVYLQESDAASQAIVKKHGFIAFNNSRNLGIMGGFEALALSASKPFLLALENDFILSGTIDRTDAQIARAHALLASGEADVVYMRSRQHPGDPFTVIEKFRRFYPLESASLVSRGIASARRLVRPDKARRLKAQATRFSNDAPQIAPFACTDLGDGFHMSSSRHLPWTNNPFMIRTSFFLDTILAFAKAAKTRRRINGFKNLEIELNCAWWRKSGFRIAHAPGLFTHGRLGGRGY